MDRRIDSGNSEPVQPRADSNGFVNRRSVGSIPTTGSDSDNSESIDDSARRSAESGTLAGPADPGRLAGVSGISEGSDDAPWTTADILAAIARLDVRGPGDCWPAKGSFVKDGYGRFFARGRDYQIHRVILEGKLERRLGPDERARHTCDNPPCGNPTHLVPGSTRDNNHDSLVRDRRDLKLSPAAVREIRAAASGVRRGDISEMARRYGVSPQYIGRVVRGAQRSVLPPTVTAIVLAFVLGLSSLGCDASLEQRCHAMCAPRAVHELSAFGSCVCESTVCPTTQPDGGR